jgi:hypothetical protein
MSKILQVKSNFSQSRVCVFLPFCFVFLTPFANYPRAIAIHPSFVCLVLMSRPVETRQSVS